MRLQKSIAAVALTAAVAFVADAQSPARCKLTFFVYDGADTRTVRQLSGQVRLKVRRLADTIVDLSYVEDIVLEHRMPPASNRLAYWRDSMSLMMAGGLVIPADTDSEFRNEIFLGEFGRNLPSALVVSMRFEQAGFASTKDALSAATLYAVAMERIGRRDTSSDTRQLLAKALGLVTDIERRGDGGADVALLRRAITAEVNRLR